MHPSAMKNAKQFFEKYLVPGVRTTIVEIGACDVGNGSLRDAVPGYHHGEYRGVDMVAGKGVDRVAVDPYFIPVQNQVADYVVSSSTFEHVEMFWVLFLEMVRITKHGGFIYLNAPSNGPYHAHPVDCWRFYKDAGQALVKWVAHVNDVDAHIEVVETYVDGPDMLDGARWEDWVAIFRRL